CPQIWQDQEPVARETSGLCDLIESAKIEGIEGDVVGAQRLPPPTKLVGCFFLVGENVAVAPTGRAHEPGTGHRYEVVVEILMIAMEPNHLGAGFERRVVKLVGDAHDIGGWIGPSGDRLQEVLGEVAWVLGY